MTDLFGNGGPDHDEPDVIIKIDDNARQVLGDHAQAFEGHLKDLFERFGAVSLSVPAGSNDDREISVSTTLRPRQGPPVLSVRVRQTLASQSDENEQRRQNRQARDRLPLEERAKLLQVVCESRLRVCPMPDPWRTVYRQIVTATGATELPLPLILGAWEHSSPFEKAARFQEHITAASMTAEGIRKVEAFVEGLSNDDWLSVPSAISGVLVSAYEQTKYRVGAGEGGFEFRIDQHSRALATFMRDRRARSALFITAYNPFSEDTSEEDNLSAHERLRLDLSGRGKRAFEGAGGDAAGDWPEEKSFLVLDFDFEEARELGRTYRQNAVVWAGADAIPRLVLLR